MITLKDLLSLKDNDGMTLKNGRRASYNGGYQVATHGIETKSARIALQTIREWNGNAGVWYSKKVFYIDKSHHVKDLDEAVEVGKAHNQQSIYDWENGTVIWLSEK